MIYISKYMIPKGFNGITLFPFIFLRDEELKNDAILINHEKIHIHQQRELLVVLFYIIYVLEWGIKLIKYKNRYIAYTNISFEREAYGNENNLNYIQNRKLWSFIKYF